MTARASAGRARRLLHRIEARLDALEDAGLSIFLLVLTLLSFVLFPVVALAGVSGQLISVAYSVLFVIGALVGDLSPRWRRLAIVLGLVSIVASWLARITPGFMVDLSNTTISILFMMLVCVALIRQVFRSGEITGHRIRGAVAVYLVIGFIFAMGFVLVEDLHPGSFHGMVAEPRDHRVRDAVYLSFVTLSTLGYGDLTPAGELARSLVTAEAIGGQLFLVVLIGRLISLSVSGPRVGR